MRIGVEYIKENLDQLVNGNADAAQPDAKRIIQGLNSAIHASVGPVFENILQRPEVCRVFALTNYLGLKSRLVTNFAYNKIIQMRNLIHLLEDEFAEVKIVGTRDGEEVDCLEHIAFFYEDRLLACSDSWDEKIHEVDKNLLYYQYLMHRHSSKM